MIDTGLSPAQIAAPKLAHLAEDIERREGQLTAIKSELHAMAKDAVKLAIAQGRDLERARGMVPRDLWDDWLSRHCPMAAVSATRWMRLAANPPDLAQPEFPAIRETLGYLIERRELKEQTSWPDYLHGIARAAKLLNFVRSHPLKGWPDEGREQLKEDLLPVAKELWPDRFS